MRNKCDEELVREVMADKKATPREKELAYRIHRLKHVEDELDALEFVLTKSGVFVSVATEH